MTLPTHTVEIAFATGPNDPAPVWVDVTQYVELDHGIRITLGRGDEFSEAQPNTLTLTLDNRDGRFTPARSGSPYFPNVKKGRRIRIRAVHNSITYDRFSGYIDEWPVHWPGSGDTRSLVTIAASSRLARLGKGTEMRSIVEEEYLAGGDPVVYYPLGEPEGATTAGNASATTQDALSIAQAGSGGTLTFGTATGPGTDDLTAPTFTRVDGTNGKYLAATVSSAATAEAAVLEAFFLTSTTPTLSMPIAQTYGSEQLELAVSSAGKLVATVRPADLIGSLAQVVSVASVNDGATHHASMRVRTNPIDIDLFLDGLSVGSDTGSATEPLSGITRLSIGGPTDSDSGFVQNHMFNGTIAHVALYFGDFLDMPEPFGHAGAGLTGFLGDSSDARFERLAHYAGVPSVESTAEVGLSTSLAVQRTTGKTALALMREVEQTEGGLLFDATNGNLTFHARSHRYNTTSSLTLSATTGELESQLDPRLDDQGLVNDMTASREGGVIVRAADATSIADHGLYRESVDLITTSDNEVVAAANWKVSRFAEPKVRISSAGVSLTNVDNAKIALLLGVELGDEVTLAGLPSQAPQSSMDFFVEGYTEDIGVGAHMLTFNLSPAVESQVWILASATSGQLGTSTVLAY